MTMRPAMGGVTLLGESDHSQGALLSGAGKLGIVCSLGAHLIEVGGRIHEFLNAVVNAGNTKEGDCHIEPLQ
jgi:hypothetical protein